MKTFDKAEGGVIDVYKLDVNDSVAMTVEFSERRPRRRPHEPLRHRQGRTTSTC